MRQAQALMKRANSAFFRRLDAKELRRLARGARQVGSSCFNTLPEVLQNFSLK